MYNALETKFEADFDSTPSRKKRRRVSMEPEYYYETCESKYQYPDNRGHSDIKSMKDAITEETDIQEAISIVCRNSILIKNY